MPVARETDVAPCTITLAIADRRWRSWRRARYMELYGVEPADYEGFAPELRQAIEAGVIAVAAQGDENLLDAASFCGWVLRQGFAAPSQPSPQTKLDKTARDIHPATAVAWLAFGEAWTVERFEAMLHRMYLVQLMLCDHAAGTVLIDKGAFDVASGFEQRDIAFVVKRDELNTAIKTLEVEAYSADNSRVLHGGDFANPIFLDVGAGKYVASPTLKLFSAEWERATAAAQRIGAVRLSASSLIAYQEARKSAGPHGRDIAVEALRGLLEEWRRNGGPPPTRADWQKGLGRELVGSQYAARRVWTKVVAPDPAYAEARQPGRRRDTKIGRS